MIETIMESLYLAILTRNNNEVRSILRSKSKDITPENLANYLLENDRYKEIVVAYVKALKNQSDGIHIWKSQGQLGVGVYEQGFLLERYDNLSDKEAILKFSTLIIERT